jgi:hypothetical protein
VTRSGLIDSNRKEGRQCRKDPQGRIETSTTRLSRGCRRPSLSRKSCRGVSTRSRVQFGDRDCRLPTCPVRAVRGAPRRLAYPALAPRRSSLRQAPRSAPARAGRRWEGLAAPGGPPALPRRVGEERPLCRPEGRSDRPRNLNVPLQALRPDQLDLHQGNVELPPVLLHLKRAS